MLKIAIQLACTVCQSSFSLCYVVVVLKKLKGVLIVPEGPYGPVPVYGWLRGPAVEHWSLADVLSLSCARLVADG